MIIGRKFDTDDWNLDELLKIFKTEVETSERCHLMATTPSATLERKPPKPTPISMATLLSPETHRITCNFCKHEHKSVDCDVVTNIIETREIVKKQGRRFICLKRAHIAKNCDSKWVCPMESRTPRGLILRFDSELSVSRKLCNIVLVGRIWNFKSTSDQH